MKYAIGAEVWVDVSDAGPPEYWQFLVVSSTSMAYTLSNALVYYADELHATDPSAPDDKLARYEAALREIACAVEARMLEPGGYTFNDLSCLASDALAAAES